MPSTKKPTKAKLDKSTGFLPGPRQLASLKAAMGYVPTPRVRKTAKPTPDMGVH